MDRTQQVDAIIGWHNEMKDLLLRAGISEKKYLYPVRDIGLFSDEEVNTLYQWLTGVYHNQYKEVRRIYKLTENDDLWDRYETFGVVGLPEQILFKRAAHQLRHVWHHPPRPRRLSHGKKERHSRDHVLGTENNPSGIIIQPEDTRTPIDHSGRTPE